MGTPEDVRSDNPKIKIYRFAGLRRFQITAGLAIGSPPGLLVGVLVNRWVNNTMSPSTRLPELKKAFFNRIIFRFHRRKPTAEKGVCQQPKVGRLVGDYYYKYKNYANTTVN